MTARLVDRYAQQGIRAYEQLCHDEGTDPYAELASMRLGHDIDPTLWTIARLAAHTAGRAPNEVDYPDWVSRATSHPDRHAQAAWIVAREGAPISRTILARRIGDPRLLGAMLDDPDPEVVACAAGNRHLTARHCRQLATHPDPRVRHAVAKRQNCPRTLLAGFANDPDSQVRLAVVQHARVTVSIVTNALADHDMRVRWAAIDDHRIPRQALIACAAHSDPILRDRAWLRLGLKPRAGAV